MSNFEAQAWQGEAVLCSHSSKTTIVVVVVVVAAAAAAVAAAAVVVAAAGGWGDRLNPRPHLRRLEA